MARRVQGGSQLRRQLRRFEPEARAEIRQAIEVAARDLAEEIRQRAPKDEGTLSQAVRYKISSDGLGASVGYSQKKSGFAMAWRRGGFTALWQEFGTRHHAPRPFVRPSFRAKLRHNLDLIDQAVRRTVKRIAVA